MLAAYRSAAVVCVFLFADVYGWPEGTFGLPMPKTGCPVGAVVDWETGKQYVKPVLLT